MGGLLLGPSIGAFGAAHFGGIGFVFVFSAITSVIAAVGIALRVREERVRAARSTRRRRRTVTEFPPDSPFLEGRAAPRTWPADAAPASRPGSGRCGCSTAGSSPRSSSTLGGYYGGGTYEVIWSLFLEGLGADLALIGLTFAMFGLPVLLLSPFAGRLVDRRGSLAFIVIGSILPAVTGSSTRSCRDPSWPCRSS